MLYELTLVVLYNSNIVFVDTGWFTFSKLYLFVCRRILWKWRVTVHELNNYFGIYQLIIGLKRLYDSREAYDATNISIVPPFEKYFTEKTIFCYTVPNYIFSCIGVLSIIYIRYVFIDSYAISFWIFIFCVLFSLCLLLATLIKYRQIVKYRGVEIIVRKNFKISIFLQLKLVFLIFCTYCITLLFDWFLILGRTFAERRLERVSILVDGIEWNGKTGREHIKSWY